MQRKFVFVPGEFYHIYNRGVEKRSIFEENKDWKRFQELLYLCNGEKPLVYKAIQGEPLEMVVGERISSVLAYALMPNHFHIVGREDTEGGLSKFVGRILTAHSMFFNAKYERSGSLFCRPFRAKHIGGDDYFRWVLSYVHLNPLDIFEPKWKERGLKDKRAAQAFLEKFPYASYGDYFGPSRKEGVILNKKALPVDISELEDVEAMLGILQGESLDEVVGLVNSS